MLAIKSFAIEMYGIKIEEPEVRIELSQSSSDRVKAPFIRTHFTSAGNPSAPTGVDALEMLVIPRLHFNETTANNARKRGKQNPDQRYFALVCTLVAQAGDRGETFPLVSHRSGKVVVRASNPGQFESGANLQWVRGSTLDSITHTGAVGINNASPDEALCVDGNIRITGVLYQPSDARIKEDIRSLDSKVQLSNIRRIPLYQYRLTDAWTETCGLERGTKQCGVLAQELREILPDAVKQASETRLLADGSEIDGFLTVNKDRLFMENVGAVRELARELEVAEARLAAMEAAIDNVNDKKIRVTEYQWPTLKAITDCAELVMGHPTRW